MTPQSNNGADHHENGRYPAFSGNGFTAADLAPLDHPPREFTDRDRADLDSLCRSVLELARGAPDAPLRIKLQDGHMSVELEWPEPLLDGAGIRSGEVVHGGPGHLSSVPDRPPEDGTLYLLAPTVGTFYHAPEPGAPPFVSVGDEVRPGQPVGILEVMKMMSTVEAVTSGRVLEFLAPDAHPVEFEQRLVALEPLAREGA